MRTAPTASSSADDATLERSEDDEVRGKPRPSDPSDPCSLKFGIEQTLESWLHRSEPSDIPSSADAISSCMLALRLSFCSTRLLNVNGWRLGDWFVFDPQNLPAPWKEQIETLRNEITI